MPQRKKREKTLNFLEFVPDDFVNLNRIRYFYRYGKVQVTLEKLFRAENIPYLQHIRRLDSVTFSHGGIVNADVLNALAPLNLRYLKIGHENQCEDSDLAALENLKELKSLNLYCSDKITDVGLAHLQKLKALSYLYVSSSYLSSSYLCRDNRHISAKGLIALTHLPCLEKLIFLSYNGCIGSGIAGESLRSFGQATTLRELKIRGNWTSAGIVKLTCWLARLPKLEHLEIDNWIKRGDKEEVDWSPLEQLFGEPEESKWGGKLWKAIRSRLNIVKFMEQQQTPVFWSEVTEQIGYDRYVYQARNILLEQGVLEEIETGEYKTYRLSDAYFLREIAEKNQDNEFLQTVIDLFVDNNDDEF